MFKAILVDINNVLLFSKKSLDDLSSEDKLFLDFNDFFDINYELLDSLKKSGIKIFAFTALNTLLNNPGVKAFLNENVQQVFSEKLLGLDKQSIYAYEFIANNKLGVKPGQVLFIDDNPINIQSAQKSGMGTLLYTDTKEVISKLKNMI